MAAERDLPTTAPPRPAPRLILLAGDPPHQQPADPGPHRSDQHGEPAGWRAVEGDVALGDGGQEEQKQPGGSHHHPALQPLLEVGGADPLLSGEVGDGGIDEVAQHVLDQVSTVLVGQDEHFDHLVRGRVGQLLLDHLERRDHPEHARLEREALEGEPERFGPLPGQRLESHRQAGPGLDVGDDVADPVWPGSPQLGQSLVAPPRVVGAGPQPDDDRGDQCDPPGAGEEKEQDERDGGGGDRAGAELAGSEI